MDVRERILAEFKELIAECRRILNEYYDPARGMWKRWPSPNDYLRVRTRTLNLIRRACGEDSDHFRPLARLVEGQTEPTHIVECLGILEAAEIDFSRGLLFDLKTLVQAEVMGDFLDQAEALLAAGYHAAAASLAGAVLEDGLRKLSDKHKVSYPAKTKIDSLNSSLAKANVYDKLVQKRIIALADIRNNADHGHPEKFKTEDVEDMLKWIQRFLADYLR